MSDNVVPLAKHPSHSCDAINVVRSKLALPAPQEGVTISVDYVWTCACGLTWRVRTGPSGWYATTTDSGAL